MKETCDYDLKMTVVVMATMTPTITIMTTITTASRTMDTMMIYVGG
jgi:hypothetical protein